MFKKIEIRQSQQVGKRFVAFELRALLHQ